MKVLYFAIVLIFACLSVYCYKVKEQLDESVYEVDELTSKIEELEAELANKNQNEETNVYNDEIHNLERREIELCQENVKDLEEILFLHKNRKIKMNIFFGMIENTKYKDSILSSSSNSYNSKLRRVELELNGTENIMDFYSKILDDYYWLYMKKSFSAD